MDVFPKFIIETDDEYGDCLIIAKCTYHKQLATDLTKVKGGGMWSYDKDTNCFTLFGKSHDFGAATLEDIRNCIKSGHVYTNSPLAFPIANKHSFQYDRLSEIVKLP